MIASDPKGQKSEIESPLKKDYDFMWADLEVYQVSPNTNIDP